MKKITLIMMAAMASFAVQSQEKNAIKYKVNTDVSSLEWVGKKVTGQHNGEVKLKEGFIITDTKNNITAGQVVIDMNTINAKDLEGEWKQKLEGHLKSKDFFSVENYPTASFEITSVTPLKKKENGNTHQVKGKLTIKGITNELSFPAKIEIKEGKIAAYGKATVDRTQYDIKYGSGKFFEGLGDKMIYDDFEITFRIAASSR